MRQTSLFSSAFAARAAMAVAAILLVGGPTGAQSQRSNAPPAPPAKGAPAAKGPPPPQAQQAPQPAPPKPYKALAVKLPEPAGDPSFATFRQQLGEIAQKRDRAGLAKLMAKTFFWDGEKGDRADKRKPAIDNLSAAIGLAGKDPVGWDTLGAASQEPSLEPSADHQGVMCAPGTPQVDDASFEALIKDTGTDAGEWGYPTKAGIEVRDSSRPGASVKLKLESELVRVMPEPPPANAKGPQGPPPTAPPALRIVLPSGEFGYVAADALSPIVFDQLCYMKDGNAWKIAGYVGGEQ